MIRAIAAAVVTDHLETRLLDPQRIPELLAGLIDRRQAKTLASQS